MTRPSGPHASAGARPAARSRGAAQGRSRVRHGAVFALALAGLLGAPATALADQTVQAVDGVLPDGTDNRWSPAAVTVKAGEQVTWSFTGTTLAHNVLSAGSNWTFASPITVGGAPVSHTFTAPGTYEFFCELHGISMRGTVTVTDATGVAPPPPPPPPLSEQPFANDIQPLTSYERIDKLAPKLTRVSVKRVKRGARVRFRLSEAGRATIALKRGKRTVKRRAVNVRKGTNAVTVRGVRAGRYRVELRVRDLSGNAAKTKRARVTVR